jgi:hypothetical protein
MRAMWLRDDEIELIAEALGMYLSDYEGTSYLSPEKLIELRWLKDRFAASTDN